MVLLQLIISSSKITTEATQPVVESNVDHRRNWKRHFPGKQTTVKPINEIVFRRIEVINAGF